MVMLGGGEDDSFPSIRQAAERGGMGAELGLLEGARGEVVAFPGHQPLGLSWEHTHLVWLVQGWVPPSPEYIPTTSIC